MEPLVDLAPGADTSALAGHFAERIRESLDDAGRRRAFMAMKATVFVVDFDSGECISLRFDHGRLTVHEGPVGIPSVTFGGPRVALESLGLARARDVLRALVAGEAPVGLVEDGRRPQRPAPDDRSSSPPPSRPSRLGPRDLARMLTRGELKVYGAVSHPRTVLRFLRLVSAPSRA